MLSLLSNHDDKEVFIGMIYVSSKAVRIVLGPKLTNLKGSCLP
jgi:hypothetical protein